MFIFQHNTFFNQSDHLARIIRQEFRDSRIGKLYSFGRTKTSATVKCISDQVFLELKSAMQIKSFSVLPNGCNDVAFEKKKIITVRRFSERLERVMTKFVYMNFLQRRDRTKAEQCR